MLKKFLSEVQNGLTPSTWWTHDQFGSNKEASLQLKDLFDGEARFQTPKPVKLIQAMCDLATEPDSLILDFFAGSGTTAHAVLSANAADEGVRRFILVQLPEGATDNDTQTIAELTRERVRRAGKRLLASGADTLPLQDHLDTGFRALSLAESNLLAWSGDSSAHANDIEQQLSLHVHHLRPGRSEDDLLFEILLKEGFPPTTRYETVTVATQEAKSMAEGALIICLSRKLDLEAVRAIANRGPQRVVCLDEGFFGNDQLKANAAQIFKAKGIVFRTV